jgi:hypothetical protein
MKKLTLVLFISTFLFTACEKVLDKKPLDIISDAIVWSDPVMIDNYLNECYAQMKFYFEMQYANDYTWFESSYPLTIADEASPAGWVGGPKSHWISIGGGNYEWWGYPTVRKLNIFLEKMATLPLADAYKKQRLAEARFLRAFAYFNMVKRYGGVPLITKPQQLEDTPEELYRKRDTEEAIYQFIISECDAVAPDLQDAKQSSDLGRPSKYAALALKSRAAMYAASIAQWGTVALDGVVGIPATKATSYWQASYDASKAILSSAKFSLYNKSADKAANYRNIFLDENNSEVIFSEIFDGISGKGHSFDMWEIPWSYHVWGAGQQAMIYLEMAEEYDNTDGTSGVIDRNKIAAGYLWTLDELFGKKDPRFKASVYTHGTSWLDKTGRLTLDYHGTIKTPDGNLQTVGSYKGVLARSRSFKNSPFGILKYLDESMAIVHERGYSKTDYIVFRLAETYLNLAEAAIELGKPAEALDAVNTIRTRAGMPALTVITRDLVRHERKIELAFEGNRYFDVRRWRTAKVDLTKSFHGLQFVLDGASMPADPASYNVLTQKFSLIIYNDVDGIPSPYFDEKHYYLPISLSRTANNPKLVENPGYQ